MTARRLASVPAPAARPRLRRVTLKRAAEVHPNADNRAKWLRAIATLRTRTRRGWILDRPTPRKETT